MRNWKIKGFIAFCARITAAFLLMDGDFAEYEKISTEFYIR